MRASNSLRALRLLLSPVEFCDPGWYVRLMTGATLEERVATLEGAVQRILTGQGESRKKDWRRTVGMFAGDELMKEIDREGERIRAQDGTAAAK